MRSGAAIRILIAAVTLPAALGAQTRVGGVGPNGQKGKPGRLARDEGISIPGIVNPVNLLIERRLTVQLNDTQFTKIIAIKRALDSTNAPMSRKLDSIARLYKPRPIFSVVSPERRDSIAQAHPVVLELVAGIRENISSARDSAYALLSAKQLATAQGIESVAEQENSGATLPKRAPGPPLTQPIKPPGSPE
jgi:hypothetical protein